MTKRVFNNDMVAHVWAQQKQDFGRSSNGQFYFNRKVICSYRDNWPLAIFTGRFNVAGRQIVLINQTSVSVTTSRHLQYVRRALHGLDIERVDVEREVLLRVMEWGKVLEPESIDAAFSLAIAQQEAREIENWRELANTRKARNHWNEKTEKWEREELTEETAKRRIDDIDLISLRAFAIRLGRDDNFDHLIPEMKSAREKVREAFASYLDPKKVAARAKAKLKRDLAEWRETAERHFASEQAQLFALINPDAQQIVELRRARERNELTPEEWRAHKPGRLPWNHSYTFGDIVRRTGDRLETGRGAQAPFAQAVAIFVKAQECRRKGVEWRANGEQYHAGHFSLDRIDAQGNIKIGCHSISFDEMLRLAVKEVPRLVKPTAALPVLIAA